MRFELARASDVRLSVVDALGREVAVLTSGRQPEGSHEVTWTPTDPTPGLYLIRLQTKQGVTTRQLVVAR